MPEQYRIIEVRGEPQPAGSVGARVLVRLDGCPSGHWSRDMSAHLINELVGHQSVGHLGLNEVVRGDQIVLEGVETNEASPLARALRRAIDATNRAAANAPGAPGAFNMSQAEASAIAEEMAHEPHLGLRGAAM